MYVQLHLFNSNIPPKIPPGSATCAGDPRQPGRVLGFKVWDGDADDHAQGRRQLNDQDRHQARQGSK